MIYVRPETLSRFESDITSWMSKMNMVKPQEAAALALCVERLCRARRQYIETGLIGALGGQFATISGQK